jgi:hypothetical protein
MAAERAVAERGQSEGSPVVHSSGRFHEKLPRVRTAHQKGAGTILKNIVGHQQNVYKRITGGRGESIATYLPG